MQEKIAIEVQTDVQSIKSKTKVQQWRGSAACGWKRGKHLDETKNKDNSLR